MIALAVFGVFGTVLLTSWTGLQTDAMNTTAYSLRQNDQMRVSDYLKRDIRRATTIAIYNGATLVTGANNYGSTLQLTLPNYYTDTRKEDDSHGTRVANFPSYASKKITYGTAVTVKYYVLNGAVIRSEGSAVRTIADAAGGFTLSFCTDTTGLIRSQINFSQRMRSGTNRNLIRQVSFLAKNHIQFTK